MSDAPRSLTSTEDEAAWARAAKDGDADAYGRLVLAHATPLRRALAPYATPSDGVDDLVQEAFVRAWQAIDRFDTERPFGPWIRRIGIRFALDRRRARMVRPEGSLVDQETVLESIAVDADALEVLHASELRELIETELASMHPEWADVLRLRAIEDMSYAEIADVLAIPKGTVMSRLARARARLALALARRFGEPTAKDENESRDASRGSTRREERP